MLIPLKQTVGLINWILQSCGKSLGMNFIISYRKKPFKRCVVTYLGNNFLCKKL